jgi:L-asparaginase II
VAEALAGLTGSSPTGPGVDGCGAPAWVLPLSGLAAGFARLAAGRDELAPVAAAMRAAPELVGGEHSVDTRLMRADLRVVAKRGAEAVLAAGIRGPDGGGLGIAVKVEDGTHRATGPVVAAVLGALGAAVDQDVAAPVVLGGGQPHGTLQVPPDLLARLDLPPGT